MLNFIIVGLLCFAAGHIIGSAIGFEKGYYKCFKDNLLTKSAKYSDDSESIRSKLNNIYDGVYES